MRVYYERHAVWMHGLMFGVVVAGSAAQIGIEGRPDFSSGGVMRMIAGIALLVGVFGRRPAVHGTVAVAMLVLMALGAVALVEPIADG
jgi:hypothetical protein